MEWQPIETAPKDGEILLFTTEGVEVGWWSYKYSEWLDNHASRVYGEATHWMPLPSPPVTP